MTKKTDDGIEKRLLKARDYEIASRRETFYKELRDADIPEEEKRSRAYAFEAEMSNLKKEKMSKYQTAYAKEKYKRLSIFVSPDQHGKIKAAASAAGESINGYVTEAIRLRLESGK